MTLETHLPKLREFLADHVGGKGEAEALGSDAPLLSSGILDSLNLFMLISYIEDEMGIMVEPDDVVPENFENLNTICTLLERLEKVPAR